MITAIFLAILGIRQPAPAKPQGYLDCAFDARNVYVCRAEQ